MSCQSSSTNLQIYLLKRFEYVDIILFANAQVYWPKIGEIRKVGVELVKLHLASEDLATYGSVLFL